MTDLISKADLFNRLASAQDKAEIFGIIQEMPVVEQNKGKFINIMCKTSHGTVQLSQCSECGYMAAMSMWNFCPNCGTDMRGESNAMY